MRRVVATIVLASLAFAQAEFAPINGADQTRIHEFYRLAAQVQDRLWPHWGQIPAPLLLVTENAEYLTHHPMPPKDFQAMGNDLWVRPRQFPSNLLATFPAFGPPSVIVIGEPAQTTCKTSTPWLVTLMHEHFHQLQNSQPGYFQALEDLGLSGGDTTGMWMLNYPFPYEKPEVASGFATLRDRLLLALMEPDREKFKVLTRQYLDERKKFFSQLSSNDGKYLNLQLWYEGIARYTQIRSAEAAADYQPSKEYAALPDFESFSKYAATARIETLQELRHTDLRQDKRLVVYSFGAGEGLLLDRIDPAWKEIYFRKPFSLAPLLQQ